jgi:hypothetical protein
MYMHGGIAMIKVFQKNNKMITFELGDERKESELVCRFHNGLDGNTVLNLKTINDQISTCIRVSDIINMQCLKVEMNKTTTTETNNLFNSTQNSKFRTRAEYEKWKELKMRENKFNSAQNRG